MAVGGLGWSPATFWRSTLAELFMAFDGHAAANRTGPEPATREELEELIAIYG